MTGSATTDPMLAPVGAVAFWVEPMYPEDSIRAAAREIAELGLPLLPIVQNNVLVGTVGEREIAAAMQEGRSLDGPVSDILDPRPLTVPPTVSGRQALQTLKENSALSAIVTDINGAFVGIVTPSRLLEPRGSRQNLGRVGGMATPFGVYLTNGVVSGGVGRWAVLASGMLMFGTFAVAGTIILGLVNNLPTGVQREPWLPALTQIGWTALFFLGVRLMPLSGTHAAEHMVVHAIERGEELKPEIVRRMPRVHPRCGTNLAVASMLFLGIMSIEFIKEQELRLLLAALVTISVWQPLGSLMQLYVTTKSPTEAQVQKGIDAGQQLMDNMARAPVSRSTIWGRIAMSGLFQVFLGAATIELILYGIYQVLKVPIAWRVT